jgi:hypothetical protein
MFISPACRCGGRCKRVRAGGGCGGAGGAHIVRILQLISLFFEVSCRSALAGGDAELYPGKAEGSFPEGCHMGQAVRAMRKRTPCT